MLQNNPIYNARVVMLYLKLLREKYPYVSIIDVLDYAGIESYEVNDEGHWITQEKIDKFYERIVQLTGNPMIAREAGRLAASPGAIGVMRQYTLGLIGPALAFAMINKATKNFTRGTEYSSQPLTSNSVEITVSPKSGVTEKPFQCENRMGFFEAIVSGFSLGTPKIEHPECLFKGGSVCRYTVTWKRNNASIALKVRDGVLAFSMLCLIIGFTLKPLATATFGLPAAITLGSLASLLAEITRRREMNRSISSLWDSSERLTEQINTNARNVQLSQDIGQALANKKSVDDVLQSVVQTMERRLDFDQGAILLANDQRTCLEIRGAYGYSSQQLDNLTATVFSLNNPNSQGPFVLSFHQQKPFLVNDTGEIENRLTAKSRRLIELLGIKSFLCCPIVADGVSLGILAVTNQSTKRPLVNGDVGLLLGVAPVIGVALQNAALIEELQNAFEKTLRVLADSIDARDFLTSGHSEAVAEYSAGVAEQLELDAEHVQMIRIAALLHDYGKIGLPDAILKKSGRLSSEEREIINTHPTKTREILSQVPFRGLHTQIPEITGAHHERWDGNGYPNGLKGKEIPLGARILAVADFFEAITAKRHYRDPMPLDVAVAQLQEASGKNFDPEVVNAFLQYMKKRMFCLITPESTKTESVYSRKSPRLEYRAQVSIKRGKKVLSGNLINISMDGAYIACQEPVGDKDELLITFTPPGTDTLVQVPGAVVWVNNNRSQASSKHADGFGIKFSILPMETETLIRRFIEQGTRKPAAASKIIYPKQFAR